MENFIFNIPIIAYVGKGQISNLSSRIKQFGGSKVLLAYGGGSIKTNGIYDSIINELNSANISFAEILGINPNPPIEDVYKGIEIYKQNNCDFKFELLVPYKGIENQKVQRLILQNLGRQYDKNVPIAIFISV